jgi:hypothetical protein
MPEPSLVGGPLVSTSSVVLPRWSPTSRTFRATWQRCGYP